MSEIVATSSWVLKLARRNALSETDVTALNTLIDGATFFAPRDIIAHEGDPADRMFVVLSGWAARCKTMRNGDRRIVGLLLPSEFTPIHSGARRLRTDSISAITRCEVAELHYDVVLELARARPAIDEALGNGALEDLAISQEWLVNLGARSSERRLAHLLCELCDRLGLTDETVGARFELPMTQATLAAALGLSPAHVNRSLQGLRIGGLATFEAGWVTIADRRQFKRFAGFDARYLHPTLVASP